MREIRTSGSVGAPGGNLRGDPTTDAARTPSSISFTAARAKWDSSSFRKLLATPAREFLRKAAAFFAKEGG